MPDTTGPPEPPANRKPPARGRTGKGRFQRSIETAESDAKAARLRSRRWTYSEIARELGYASVSSAYEAVQRAIAAAPRESGEHMRKLELDDLDDLARAAREVLQAVHYSVNPKGVVYLDDQPLTDDAPKLAAVRTLLQIAESRRKLLGLDAETKVAVTGGLKYELVGVDPGEITGQKEPE